MIAAIQALFAGMELQSSERKDRQDFEMELNHVAEEKLIKKVDGDESVNF